MRASRASGSRRASPLFATITGSTTRGRSPCSTIFAATASMIRLFDEHSCLGCIRADIFHNGVDLAGDELRGDRVHALDSYRVLRGQRRDGAGSENTDAPRRFSGLPGFPPLRRNPSPRSSTPFSFEMIPS